MTANKQSTVNEFIKKWGISRQVLANKVGMERTTLLKKANPDYKAYSFKDEELKKLKSVFQEMKKELDGIVK